MDYIKLKAKVAELEKKSVDWDRKVEIVKMDVNRTRRQAGTAGSSRPGSKMNLGGSMRTTPFASRPVEKMRAKQNLLVRLGTRRLLYGKNVQMEVHFWSLEWESFVTTWYLARRQ
eukprot:TRINITY_DN310_c0_g1_i3.p1 TRINITY_DN310_c0_g1~~TRINITY_DN310_c0_g1_i3.p1  ORF type:complete len:115 (-),score=13.72 TRINITY_DN310_c0_g1_i3:105-449(-)